MADVLAQTEHAIITPRLLGGDIDPRLDAEVAARILADGSRWVASMIFSDTHDDAVKMLVWNWVDSGLQLGLTNDFVKAIAKSSNRKSRRTS